MKRRARTKPARPSGRRIEIRGASQNNLKDLDLDIPLGELVVVTGVSGSGKSTLAFDTLYAEGQRRYAESFSAYARQFLERMAKAEVQSVRGIPPAIAIDQSDPVRTSRSTVGTMTDITDHLKLLFARAGLLHCRECDQPVVRETPGQVVRQIEGTARDGARLTLSFPRRLGKGLAPETIRRSLTALGFDRILDKEGKPRDLGDLEDLNIDSDSDGAVLDVLVDRVIWKPGRSGRLQEAIETAYRYGDRQAIIRVNQDGPVHVSGRLHCAACDIEYREPTPNHFSFNSPIGAGETCRGFGRTIDIDLDLAIPNPRLSLNAGVIKPWTSPGTEEQRVDLRDFCAARGIDMDRPFGELSDEDRRAVLRGADGFSGVKGYFDWLETKTYKMHVRVLLSYYRAYRTCQDCGGARLKRDALLTRVMGQDIATLSRTPIGDLLPLIQQIKKENAGNPAVVLIADEVASRLHYLIEVGLEYLTLDRQSRTLSGGEVQRVNLTAALGSRLVHTLYVLDEPSIGLHARDNRRLLGILKELRSLANTLVVVEHDPDIITGADRVLDLGPGAGALGGQILHNGSLETLLDSSQSLTGAYLSGRRSIPVPASTRKIDRDRSIGIRGARLHNLDGLDVDIPLGVLTVLTGVSGSGKSTLLLDVLHAGIHRALGRRGGFSAPAHDSLDGVGLIDDVVLVDQTPVGRTPRANPATYVGAYTHLRKLFAAADGAAERGFTASSFSFNAPGGRCEICRGEGFEKVEMQFLPDVFVPCDACGGLRFGTEILQVSLKGLNIAQVLELTADQAIEMFQDEPKLQRSLEPLRRVGLGYMRLGQPINTLSGGEAQRLKLAAHLERGRTGRRGTLFLLDEPTTGLHLDDVRVLVEVLQHLVDAGNSVVVIEHHLDVIRNADHVIDLGPEGGPGGGQIVVTGTPAQVARCARSHTGRVLSETRGPLDRSPARGRGKTPPAVPALQGAGEYITLRGARVHNLKGLDLDVPLGKRVVITGVSGSGKSTLAFDILHAEGRRRYLDALSTFARQYIQQSARPDVDVLAGLPPTIALEQRTSRAGARSTVATVTEVYHFLRLLYARAGEQHCHLCGDRIGSLSPIDIARRIRERHRDQELRILAPLVTHRKGFHKDVFTRAAASGVEQVRVDGEIASTKQPPGLDRFREHSIAAVVAEVAPSGVPPKRLGKLLARAFELGGGSAIIQDSSGEDHLYNSHLFCPRCGIGFPEPDPRRLSFNSVHGSCPGCNGMGKSLEPSEDLLIPDRSRSLRDGALAIFERRPLSQHERSRYLKALESRHGVPLDRPFQELSVEHRQLLLHGGGDGRSRHEGLLERVSRYLASSDEEMEELTLLGRSFAEAVTCSACEGKRLKPDSLSILVSGHSIADFTSLSVSRALGKLESLRPVRRDRAVIQSIQSELLDRLRFLDRVGVGYLELDRSAESLSGGETQRVRLAAQLGSSLTGVLYVLDEPTIGLHPRDTERLLDTLGSLTDGGNTVVVVEHDDDTIRWADEVIDLGPEAGRGGGQLVTRGSPAEIASAADSPTATSLREGPLAGIPMPRRKVTPAGASWLELLGAKEHNLKRIDVRIPLERFVCVTGVSGSGKSTLVRDVLRRGLQRLLTGGGPRPGAHKEIRNHQSLERVVEVDQSPIGRTPRSVPATYIGAYDAIRRLYAGAAEARARGYGPGRFSFNVKEGRCPACEGAGEIRIQMNFLPDVRVTCEECDGRRFDRETLEVRLEGKSIADVLEMTCSEAKEHFGKNARIRHYFEVMERSGLGYLTLGQPSNTLSGGEAQRVKLAEELGKRSVGRTLFVLDEPTTGLHARDVKRLLEVLHSLVDRGHTLVVIEHNPSVMASADLLIDLGPEGGEAGGKVVGKGTPEQLARKATHTGRYLRELLDSWGRGKAGNTGAAEIKAGKTRKVRKKARP